MYSATKLKAYYVKYAIFVQCKINGLQTDITATPPPVVLTLDGNSENVANVNRKMGLFG